MSQIRSLLVFFGFFIFALSCTSSQDNPVTTVPEVVSYSQDVAPILSASCGGGCHGGDGVSGFSISDYDAVMSSVGVQYGSRVVIEGNASQSPLIDKLGSSPRFGVQMPIGRNPLTQTQVSILSSWVENGAEDN